MKSPKPQEVRKIVDVGWEDPNVIEFGEWKGQKIIRIARTYSVANLKASGREITWTPSLVPGQTDLAYGKGGFTVGINYALDLVQAILDVYNEREGTNIILAEVPDEGDS